MDDNFTFLATPADTGDNYSSVATNALLHDQNLIRLRQTIAVLYQYLLPFIIIMGLVGNLLSFLVFSCTYLRRMSSSVYLAAISVADFAFLLSLFFNWLDGGFGVRLIHTDGWCQFFIYVTYVASFLSVWYVVCFTVERYLTVCFPLLRQRICQPRRTKIIVVVVAALGLLIYSFSVWTTVVVQPYGCSVDERYYKVVLTITNVDTFVTLVVPGLIITVSNIRISYSLSKFYRFYRTRRRAERLDSSGASNSSNDNNNPTIYSNSSYNRLQMKVTKMLLLVSSVFLLCNTPSHVIRVYAFVSSMVDPHYSPTHLFLLVQRLTMLLYYAGFSTNVILYNVSGKTFRLAFARLFRCLFHRIAGVVCRRCYFGSNPEIADDHSGRGLRYQMRRTESAYS